MKIFLKALICFVLLTTVVFAQTDRPVKPGPDIASDKPNVPAKKETFMAKLERYKAEGFKVAVDLNAPDSIFTKFGDATYADPKLGGVPINTDFSSLAESFAKAMNEEFETDVFEIVDDMKIPMKTGKMGFQTLDWASTKYKMVVTYSVSAEYDLDYFMDKYKGLLRVTQMITGTEYVNEKGKVKMKYPIRGGNMGAHTSSTWESETNVTNTAELHKLVDPAMGDELVSELAKRQSDAMPKLIAKVKK